MIFQSILGKVRLIFSISQFCHAMCRLIKLMAFADLTNTLTVPTKHPLASLKSLIARYDILTIHLTLDFTDEMMVRFFLSKFHGVLVDLDLNARYTVLVNIYQLCRFTGLKLLAYLIELSKRNMTPEHGYLLRTSLLDNLPYRQKYRIYRFFLKWFSDYYAVFKEFTSTLTPQS
jgi:hypothetical protein